MHDLQPHIDSATQAITYAFAATRVYLHDRGRSDLFEESYLTELRADGQDWTVLIGLGNVTDVEVEVREAGAFAYIRNRDKFDHLLPLQPRATLGFAKAEVEWMWDAVMGEEPRRGTPPSRFDLEAALDRFE